MHSATLRAASYGRYSSDLQNPKSAAEQHKLLRRYAEQKGYKIVAEYSDEEKTGKTMFHRTGLIDLMRAAMRREFDVVLVEQLDRLSRDQEDMHGIAKRLKHNHIVIDTINGGVQKSIDIGVRGLLAQMWLEDHGNRIRGRMSVLVQQGRAAGGLTYGYRTIPGKPGEWEIDAEQAEIIRRIFREYIAGVSPRAIAKRLNLDNVPSPTGGQWTDHNLLGSQTARGVLRNEIYIGHRIWNRVARWTDADTGKVRKELRPESEWHRASVPHLRIIDDQTWQAAQAVADARAVQRFGPAGKVIGRRPFIARSPHLLAGILRCGVCGSPMRITHGDAGYAPRVSCAVAKAPTKDTICEHRRTYGIGRLQALIMDALDEAFANPEAIARAVQVYHDQFAKRDRERRADFDGARKRLANIEAAKLRLVDALEKGSIAVDVIVQRLNALEAERAGLAERVRLGNGDPANLTILHPKARERFIEGIKILKVAIRADKITPAARVAFGNVIEAVQVHPVAKFAPYEINVHVRNDALIGGLDLFPKTEPVREIIKARGGKLCASSVPTSVGTAVAHNSQVPVNLGRFRERRAA
jgi:site-specific DNA recombinase